jgi:AcrR family transcriptional regulator
MIKAQARANSLEYTLTNCHSRPVTPRRYDSPVRTAQREATAAHIVETALAMVAERGLDELTIPAVASEAGVSPATVYRHFPSLDDLVLGVLGVMRPRIGQTRERLEGRRAPVGADVLRPLTPGVAERDVEIMAGAMFLLVGPQAWRWLRETWGLDAEAATRAATWAIRVLTESLARGERP